MNSIKSNPFVSALIGITVVVCGVLFYLASKAGGRYDDAKAAFEESYAAVGKSESIPLYPTPANRDGKRKALGEYRESIGELSALFDKYRPDSLTNIEPQAFTDRLKEANKETTAAFESAGCEMPEGFFLGFEAYRSQLAKEGATGVLGYQLDGIKHILRGLADARPTQLIRLHREPVPEETGGDFTRAPGDVARNFPFELTFKGSESAARKFINHLGETDPYYIVVRCVKIVNERDTPPQVKDAKFEKEAPAAAAAAQDIFSNVFVLPGAQPQPAAPAPAAVEEVDATPILIQVLGSEEITVFVRFDISMFLPSEELPKP